MKIYFLAYNIYGMGGTVRTIANTANYLASQNYNVEIISMRRTSQEPLFSIDKRVKITPLVDARKGRFYSKKRSIFTKGIKKILNNLPSVLIHRTEDLYPMFSLFTDLKLVFSLKKIKHGLLVTTIPSFNILSARLVSKNVYKIGQEHKSFNVHSDSLKRKIVKYYPKLNALTCLTEYEKSVYKQRVNCNKLKIYKIGNGTKIPHESAKLNEKTIIAAGRYVNEKGFDYLIESFIEVLKFHPDWKLKIFGSGKEEQNLRSMIFNAHAYNNIFLIPTTNNILKEMLNSSFYVLSSRNESFGMVIIEAMSVGVPCISFNCSGPVEIIKDKVDGIIVEKENVTQLTQAMLKLIENVDLRKELGKNAKRNVKRFSLEDIGKKWDVLLKESEVFK
ncbi:glycosyltransferase family 4 protein [Paenibacillus dendritiformis]|uniref:glycosyltransferase family 4 protein n=2 Tax=Paenibacillus dendritiformis TaxID=130049 RepID=UPI00143CFD2C|nr:glycosyltransferase family 4 protein [Paenibacillus dendritiformis]NKI24243.1 glycosyltransferase family 4 protein [Paenibacillus dendritiformis]